MSVDAIIAGKVAKKGDVWADGFSGKGILGSFLVGMLTTIWSKSASWYRYFEKLLKNYDCIPGIRF